MSQNQPQPKTDVIVDASHWQGAINWAKLAAAGILGAFVKCSNGAFQTDDTYGLNISGARDAGMSAGGYHFMLSDQTPEDQARKFLDNMHNSHRAPNLLPALDLEYDIRKPGEQDRWLKVPQESIVAMVGRYCLTIREALGVLPIIYTNLDWWKNRMGAQTSYKGLTFGDMKLWVARVPKPGGALLSSPGILPTPFKRWTIWQFTWEGSFPGAVKGHIDVDRLAPGVKISDLQFSQKAR